MTLEKFLLLSDFMTLLYVIGSVFTLIYFSKRSEVAKLIGLGMFVSAIFQRGFYICKDVLGINVNYSGSLYNMIALPIFAITFSKAFSGKKIGIPFFVICLLIDCFFIINVFFIQKEHINSYSNLVLSFAVIAATLYYFYWLLKYLPAYNVQRLPMFWFSVGNLVYFAGALFLFAFTDYLVQVLNNNLLLYWSFHNVLAIVQIFFALFALWIDLRNKQVPSLN